MSANTSTRPGPIHKLHSILAVESDSDGRAKKIIQETTSTFKNKETLFTGRTRTLTMFGKSEANKLEMEAIEQKEGINVPLATTVPECLNYMASIVQDYYNVNFTKEATNQLAKADLIYKGAVIIEDAPVTFLLGMEHRLKDLRNVFEEIPTLDSAILWNPDETSSKKYVYKAPPTHDTRTAKTTEHKVVVAATDKHPAQIFAYEATANVGQFTDTKWSGKLSPASKATLLANIDEMIASVKKARQIANETPLVSNVDAGQKIFQCIFGSIYDTSNVNPDTAIK